MIKASRPVTIALRTQMDEGEAEAISLALELENVLLILDDKKARLSQGIIQEALRLSGEN